MTIRRAVPDLMVADLGIARNFYRALGFDLAMDLGWAVTLASPHNDTAQITLLALHSNEPALANLTVEVADIDAVHERLRELACHVLVPPRDEPWGVRRFFVEDPDGHVVNVMMHRSQETTRRDGAGAPTRRRPKLGNRPADGEPLSWSDIEQRLQQARNYWVATPTTEQRPRVRPVWGLWSGDAFEYSTGARGTRGLDRRAGATVHLESADEVVIVEGEATLVRDEEGRRRFVDSYNAKYSWDLEVRDSGVGDDHGAQGEVVRIHAHRVYAWTTQRLDSATRWDLLGDQG